MRQFFKTLVSAGDATANPLNSAKLDARQLYSLSVIIVSSSGSNAGTLKLQGSNDPCAFGNVADDFTPTNWVDIASATVTVASGAIGTFQVNPICYAWLRVVWTPTGGAAGTITVNVNGQGF